jgi:DNA-binding beta-propeller fold protein YncE
MRIATKQVGTLSGGFLNDPLGLTIAPGGDIVSANGNDGNIAETTPAGQQVAKELIMNGTGDLFGLAVAPHGRGLYFVNDGENTLDLLS